MNTPWNDQQLTVLGSSDELELTIAGKTTIIWMVTVGGEVFVRSVYGRASKWFQRALSHNQGEAATAGVRQAISWCEPQLSVHPGIDQAFRAKYGRYAKSIVDSTVTPKAQSATLQLFRL